MRFDNETIRDAVIDFFDNREYAEDWYGPISEWNVRYVTDMSYLFVDEFWFNDVYEQDNVFNEDISKWNVSNVFSMEGMFHNCIRFNQPLNNWNVSNVTNMSVMFAGATSFNQPLDKWDVSNVKSMNSMFYFADTFNQPLNEWDVSKVTDFAGMFQNAVNFNQPLNDWNVSKAKTVSSMFFNATSFDQPLVKWDITKLEITWRFTHHNVFSPQNSYVKSIQKWNESDIMKKKLKIAGVSDDLSYYISMFARNHLDHI